MEVSCWRLALAAALPWAVPLATLWHGSGWDLQASAGSVRHAGCTSGRRHLPAGGYTLAHYTTPLLCLHHFAPVAGSPRGASWHSNVSLPPQQSLVLARLQRLTGASILQGLPEAGPSASLTGDNHSTMLTMAADELPSIVMSAMGPGSRLHQAVAAAAGLAPPRIRGNGNDGSTGGRAAVAEASEHAGQPAAPRLALPAPAEPAVLAPPGSSQRPYGGLGNSIAPIRSVSLNQPALATRASGSSGAISLSLAGGGSGGGGSALGRYTSSGLAGLQLGGSSGAAAAAASPFFGASEVAFNSKATSEGDTSEEALVQQLANEAQANREAGVSTAMPARLAEMSRQLVDIASSLSPANASMLLDRGYSLVVPVLPTSIFEHTLVARPNFKLRCAPAPFLPRLTCLHCRCLHPVASMPHSWQPYSCSA